MRPSTVFGVVVLAGCSVATSGARTPSSAEIAMRAVDPLQVPMTDPDAPPGCDDAITAVDRRIAAGELHAEEELARAEASCGGGYGVQWRRGWLARERGEYDEAASAYLLELWGPSAVPATGAQLLEVLPEAKPVWRRRAAKLVRSGTRRSGWQGVETERIVGLRCRHGKIRGGAVRCSRESCTYRYYCGGRRVEIRSGGGIGQFLDLE